MTVTFRGIGKCMFLSPAGVEILYGRLGDKVIEQVNPVLCFEHAHEILRGNIPVLCIMPACQRLKGADLAR